MSVNDHLRTFGAAVFFVNAVVIAQEAPTPEASPTATTTPAAPPVAAASAQAEAVAKYPELGKPGSAFNLEFVARFKRSQVEKPEMFSDAAWPLRLADEVSAELTRVAMEAAKLAAENLGPRIVAFCQANIARKVGDGECAALAVRALAFVGAVPMGRDAPGKGDYVWGSLVAFIEGGKTGSQKVEGLAEIRPGDVIQFRDARFEGKNRETGRGRYWMEARHHSAVVAEVNVGQGVLGIFHQNWGGHRHVKMDTLHLSDMVRGWVRFYRPQPNPVILTVPQ